MRVVHVSAIVLGAALILLSAITGIAERGNPIPAEGSAIVGVVIGLALICAGAVALALTHRSERRRR